VLLIFKNTKKVLLDNGIKEGGEDYKKKDKRSIFLERCLQY
tara:strand:+ start:174 stop:296 length:123 start_codon:yes stop_codon:yes gene_type:complete